MVYAYPKVVTALTTPYAYRKFALGTPVGNMIRSNRSKRSNRFGSPETPSARGTPDRPGRSAHVQIDEGVYSGVLAATLGQVHIEVGSRTVLVHPFFVLLACVPCLWFQVSALFAIRTAMDVKPNLGVDKQRQAIGEDSAELWSNYSLVRLQVLVIGLFYIMNFRMLLASLKHIVFLSNPFTWVEVQHTTYKEWSGEEARCIFSSFFFAGLFMRICAGLAALMRFGIGYLVCIDSESLILATSSSVECIFNCMAITFIVDLDGYWWHCVRVLFHIGESPEKTQLLPDAEVWSDNGEGNELVSTCCAGCCRGCLDFVVKWTTWDWCEEKSWLSRQYGFVAVEQFVCLVCLCGIYKRQSTIVFFALETGVLPVTRDVCAHFQLHNGELKADSWISFLTIKVLSVLNAVLEKTMLISAQQEFDNLSMRKDGLAQTLDCTSEKYRLMTSEDAAQIHQKYWHVYLCIIFVLGSVFFGPRAVLFAHSCFFRAEDGRKLAMESVPEEEALISDVEGGERGKYDTQIGARSPSCSHASPAKELRPPAKFLDVERGRAPRSKSPDEVTSSSFMTALSCCAPQSDFYIDD